MTRDQLVARLRSLKGDLAQLARLQQALESLDPCQREIIEKMYISPVRYAGMELCEKFSIEMAAVYRRRNKALQKLSEALGEMR